MNQGSHRILVLVVCLLVNPLFAGGVRWGNELGSSAIDSQGGSLDSSWTFFLGYFDNGFTPTSSNSSEWSGRWTTLDVSGYSPSSQLFGKVWDNDGLSTGRQGYVWGLNRSLPSNEWVLFSANSWVVPFNNPLNPDVNWFTSDADLIVVGAIEEAELQTAAVVGEPPLLTGEHWLQLNFDDADLSDPLIAGWDADPDADGSTNLEEFAFGGNPSQPNLVCLEGKVVAGFFQFSCQRARAVQALYFGQVSSNVLDWDEGDAFVFLQSSNPEELIYRDLTSVSSAGSTRFGRVRVELMP
ncbi:MAG: hypothetical protein ACSHYB_18820 [Roseibacillus sp.]